ncbi:non-homologous end-joining DNA ligase [Pseudomonas stutzeri]|uniref:ATP-dependent DNA ligase n=1 Tax=Stutzerimonas stutzeri TaxID=316 RepID=A0A2N8S0E4_STUST|nr:non-homologous end-joining DNA ligase [Stutzerimonas stutzeri]MCQ4295435.1 non-homologous end-joining DNA ligase [Stutzerimonas stutzeri]PNF80081.1 ATP-dependent DNA ligase [Stutzerimonas stutzeri]
MPAKRKSVDRPLVGGIGISNPQRVIDEASGTTKVEVAEYYLAVADWLMPHLTGRPLSIVRAPEGIGGESFFQRHCGRLKMPHMRTLPKDLDPKHARLIQADDITAVIEAAQMGTVEFHTWNARSDRIERPDRVIFDLDPDPALPWSRMVEATELTLALLEELGLQAFLKTSGGRGMHVVVPIERRHDWDCARSFAQGVTQRLGRQNPERIACKMGAQNRVGRIFVDYLRNQRGASTVAAYSVRARPGLGVSLPVSLDEVRQLDGADQWRLDNVRAYLGERGTDPWAEYGSTRQRLGRDMLEQLRADG